MTDPEYIELARRDSTWREVVVSFAIEDMMVTEESEIIAGKMIAGEIELIEAISLVRQNSVVTEHANEGRLVDGRDTG